MAALRSRRNRKKRNGLGRNTRPFASRTHSETEFKGPNVNKPHRKPDEIYGDASIPDSARKE
jgi:hypothetical protein